MKEDKKGTSLIPLKVSEEIVWIKIRDSEGKCVDECEEHLINVL
jgi:hypothetical protein